MSARVPLDTPAVAKEIPDVITDPSTKRTYERGKFLGKVNILPNVVILRPGLNILVLKNYFPVSGWFCKVL